MSADNRSAPVAAMVTDAKSSAGICFVYNRSNVGVDRMIVPWCSRASLPMASGSRGLV
jgi:hypothetical protein